MQAANPLWGAPRIHGKLQKLAIGIAQATVGKYLARRRGTWPSQTWRAFLSNHVAQFASVDFFTVPTATFRVLSVFVVLAQDRRRIVHVNVTAHPTAAWTAEQLREPWPWASAPRFVRRMILLLVPSGLSLRSTTGRPPPRFPSPMRAGHVTRLAFSPAHRRTPGTPRGTSYRAPMWNHRDRCTPAHDNPSGQSPIGLRDQCSRHSTTRTCGV
jgi:hypothetical protein